MRHKNCGIGVAALLWGGTLLAGCGFGGGDEAEISTSRQALVSTVRATALGTDTFLYVTCNATSWSLDDKSRLRPTADPYVWSLDYDVKEPWMVSNADNCLITETNQYNGWGTTQSRYTTMGANLTAPAADRLKLGSTNFNVKYPTIGRYTITVNWMQGNIAIAAAISTPTATEWPNSQSKANSDAWLRQNHDQIKVMKPRVLVIHANKRKTLADTQNMAGRTMAAFRESSRYHGYSDSEAPVTLDYQLEYVDLTQGDAANTDWPAVWPASITEDGSAVFDSTGLFSPAFAAALNFRDPKDNHVLSMCELFETGRFNEVWTQAPRERFADGSLGNPVGIYESKSRAQVYDANLNPIPGLFDSTAGNGSLDTGPNGQCKVTVRFLELLTTDDRGVGCTLEAAGHGIEGLADRGANPYLKANSARFFNFDLGRLYGLPFYSTYDYCPSEAPSRSCYVYPDANTITLGNISPVPEFRTAFRFSQWGQGCGNTHFPPNGQSAYDFGNSDVTVNCTCENYGLRNGTSGADKQTAYNASLSSVLLYSQLYPDCASGWEVYMFQSMPGYHNSAIGEDGKPMKSWLPFMFY